MKPIGSGKMFLQEEGGCIEDIRTLRRLSHRQHWDLTVSTEHVVFIKNKSNCKYSKKMLKAHTKDFFFLCVSLKETVFLSPRNSHVFHVSVKSLFSSPLTYRAFSDNISLPLMN